MTYAQLPYKATFYVDSPANRFRKEGDKYALPLFGGEIEKFDGQAEVTMIHPGPERQQSNGGQ